MKKINCGSEDLIPKSEWVDEVEIQSSEEQELKHPMLNKAFEEICKRHIPKHKIAFVSLCTSTRPYSKGLKWKKFKEFFSDKCDLIISSGGGIIPIEFENCYPYLTYDILSESKCRQLYIDTLLYRFNKFFKEHHYDYIIFNYRPSQRSSRNREAAEQFIKNCPNNTKCFILPTESAYEEAKKNKFKPFGHHYPDLSVEVINEIQSVLNTITE